MGPTASSRFHRIPGLAAYLPPGDMRTLSLARWRSFFRQGQVNIHRFPMSYRQYEHIYFDFVHISSSAIVMYWYACMYMRTHIITYTCIYVMIMHVSIVSYSKAHPGSTMLCIRHGFEPENRGQPSKRARMFQMFVVKTVYILDCLTMASNVLYFARDMFKLFMCFFKMKVEIIYPLVN